MTRRDTGPATARTTPAERAAVLGGFALAALGTAPAALLEAGAEAVAALWLAAAAWAFVLLARPGAPAGAARPRLARVRPLRDDGRHRAG